MDKFDSLFGKIQDIKLGDLSNEQLRLIMERLHLERDFANFVKWEIEKLNRETVNAHDFFNHSGFSDMKVSEFIQHHGIMGMRWGVRRPRGKGGLVSGKKTSGSADFKEAQKQKAKGFKNLSTSELKSLTTRLQLEKQMKDLSPSQFKKGMNVVKSITAAGTTVASLYALTKTPLGQDVVKVVKNSFKK